MRPSLHTFENMIGITNFQTAYTDFRSGQTLKGFEQLGMGIGKADVALKAGSMAFLVGEDVVRYAIGSKSKSFLKTIFNDKKRYHARSIDDVTEHNFMTIKSGFGLDRTFTETIMTSLKLRNRIRPTLGSENILELGNIGAGHEEFVRLALQGHAFDSEEVQAFRRIEPMFSFINNAKKSTQTYEDLLPGFKVQKEFLSDTESTTQRLQVGEQNDRKLYETIQKYIKSGHIQSVDDYNYYLKEYADNRFQTYTTLQTGDQVVIANT